METQNRQLYATPILWRQLKTKLAQDIADSQLLACEVETIVKELYDQIRVCINPPKLYHNGGVVLCHTVECMTQ